MKIRVAFAMVALIGLAAAPEALAKAPILVSVGSIDRHPTATWTLPPGVEAAVAEVARSPATSSDGYFFAENRVAFDVLEATQTTWTDNSQVAPGTYYVHIAGLDRPCFYASQCPVREFTQTVTLVIAAPPPPVVVFSLTVFKTGTGTGTVTSDPPGINCGSDCSESYNAGNHVMLTATAAPGSVFAGWNNVCGLSPRCEGILTGPLTPTARFDLAPAAPVPAPVPTPPVATPAAVDTTAPKVKALPAAGASGLLVRLRFTINEATQRTRQQVVVYSGSRTLLRRNLPMSFTARGAIKSLGYRIPKTAKRDLRFCVVAWDRAGNASNKSCGRVSIL